MEQLWGSAKAVRHSWRVCKGVEEGAGNHSRVLGQMALRLKVLGKAPQDEGVSPVGPQGQSGTEFHLGLMPP